MNIFFTAIIAVLVLLSCKVEPKQTDIIQQSEISKYIIQNAANIDTSEKHVFIGFEYGMNSDQYWSHTDSLLKKKQIHLNERNDSVYDLELMGKSYKALLVGEFIPTGLTKMVLAYSTPKGIEHDSVKAETLSFLKFMHGDTPVITYTSGWEGMANGDTMYHWFDGTRQHIIYLNSKTLNTHRITFTDAYQEYLELKK